jgi:hypothetical protein
MDPFNIQLVLDTESVMEVLGQMEETWRPSWAAVIPAGFTTLHPLHHTTAVWKEAYSEEGTLVALAILELSQDLATDFMGTAVTTMLGANPVNPHMKNTIDLGMTNAVKHLISAPSSNFESV